MPDRLRQPGRGRTDQDGAGRCPLCQRRCHGRHVSYHSRRHGRADPSRLHHHQSRVHAHPQAGVRRGGLAQCHRVGGPLLAQRPRGER